MNPKARLFDETPRSIGGLIVRRMRREELQEVMELEHRAFEHPWSAELLRRELTHDWSTILVAVDARQKIVGFVIFWVVVDEIHILNVAVAPEERRKGVARLLLTELFERGRSRGLVVVTLEVRRSNTAAIALYRRLGFRQVGVRRGYYREENEDAIVMNLGLSDA